MEERIKKIEEEIESLKARIKQLENPISKEDADKMASGWGE